MKLVSFSLGASGLQRVGRVEGDRVYPVSDQGMLEYLKGGGEPFLGDGEGLLLDEVRLHAPVPNPEKIVCIGLNYEDHAEETGAAIPEQPIVFSKYANSIVGHEQPVVIPPITTQVDYEAELAVVIGRAARNVSESEAMEHVYGYTNANDVSARDIQLGEGGQWTRGKAIDTFCPLGPYLVTKDEVEDPQDLSIRCTLNGETVQDGTTSKMIFPVSELVAFLSTGMTLEPGDVIITGTPPGVGMARDPQLWIKPGDEVTIEIENLGALTNPVEGE